MLGRFSLTLCGLREGSMPSWPLAVLWSHIHSPFAFHSLLTSLAVVSFRGSSFFTYPLKVGVLCISLSPHSLGGSMQAGAPLPELRASRGVYSWHIDPIQGIEVMAWDRGGGSQTWPEFTSQLSPLLAVDLRSYFALFFSLSFFACEMR